MSQLPNPNSNKDFDRIQGDYGYRQTDGGEETVHIPTNRSNMQYWQPEPVLSPEGCEHQLEVIDMGKRECECAKCHWSVTFNAATDYHEKDGESWLILKKKKYPISL